MFIKYLPYFLNTALNVSRYFKTITTLLTGGFEVTNNGGTSFT